MTHQFQVLGIALSMALLAYPTLGAESRGASDSLLSCPDGFKAVPEGAPFGADENIELLALQLSAGPWADRAIYERLVRDVSAIRRIEKRVKLVTYRARYDARLLNVHLTPDALAQAKQGRYEAWNCLNSHLGAHVTEGFQPGYMEVRFSGPYKVEMPAESYSKLVGVTHAAPGLMIGDGSNIYVTRRGANWVYVFDLAGGDCPVGCTTHELYYFHVSAGGRAREIATWKPSSAEPPGWVKSYFRQYH